MAFSLTRLAKIRSDQVSVEPNVVLEIDGIDTKFGSEKIKKYIKIGDPNLEIDDSWVIGGYNLLEDQLDVVSLEGTTSSISQQLLQDKGGASSVSSYTVSLIDENEKVTRLITPVISGLSDILATKARVYLGFSESAFPEDYIIIFQGLIDEVSAGGKIDINISHPEQKKRQEILPKVKTELTQAATNTDTTLYLETVANIVPPDPSGVIESYVRIKDEIIKFTGISGNTLTGCVRAQFGTVADSYAVGDGVETMYRLQGNAFDLALMIMLSKGGWYGVKRLKNIVRTVGTTDVPKSVFIEDIDAKAVYGIVPGDKIRVYDALNPSNNVSSATIESIEVVEGGTVIETDYAFTLEINTPASVDFMSKYDVLQYVGLGLTGDEVDVEQFERIKDLFNSSLLDIDFFAKDTLSAKEFIDTQILFPCACYSLPRKGRVSVGFSGPPIALEDAPVFNDENVTNPQRISGRRSINRNFYNAVLFSYDEDYVDDKMLRGELIVSGDSTQRIKIKGLKPLKIEAKGVRFSNQNIGIIRTNAQRLLERYRFAAESYEVTVFYGDGFNVEVGDIVVFGSPELRLPDITTGSRDYQPRLFEVVNKSMNIRSGEVRLSLLDTAYSLSGRYGVFSPSSKIVDAGVDYVVIDDSFALKIGMREWEKWVPFIKDRVAVRSEDWTQYHECRLEGLSLQNKYRLELSGLTVTPQPGWILDFPLYQDQLFKLNRKQKTIHCFIGASVPIVSGISNTEFIVSSVNLDKFLVGSTLTVRDDDWTVVSQEVRIVGVDTLTNKVTVNPGLGFTPGPGYFAETLFFKDEGQAYRYI